MRAAGRCPFLLFPSLLFFAAARTARTSECTVELQRHSDRGRGKERSTVDWRKPPFSSSSCASVCSTCCECGLPRFAGCCCCCLAAALSLAAVGRAVLLIGSAAACCCSLPQRRDQRNTSTQATQHSTTHHRSSHSMARVRGEGKGKGGGDAREWREGRFSIVSLVLCLHVTHSLLCCIAGKQLVIPSLFTPSPSISFLSSTIQLCARLGRISSVAASTRRRGPLQLLALAFARARHSV